MVRLDNFEQLFPILTEKILQLAPFFNHGSLLCLFDNASRSGTSWMSHGVHSLGSGHFQSHRISSRLQVFRRFRRTSANFFMQSWSDDHAFVVTKIRKVGFQDSYLCVHVGIHGRNGMHTMNALTRRRRAFSSALSRLPRLSKSCTASGNTLIVWAWGKSSWNPVALVNFLFTPTTGGINI